MIYLTYDCLIVEDEKPLAENTCKYLNLSGIRSEAVFSVEGYYEFMDANTARMILLDINLGADKGGNTNSYCVHQFSNRRRKYIIGVKCRWR